MMSGPQNPRRAGPNPSPIQLEPVHLLEALLGQRDGVVSQVFQKLGADPQRARQEAEAALERLPKLGEAAQLYVSPQLKRVLDAAQAEAERLKDEYVSTEHLLIGIAASGGGTEAGRVLASLGITLDRIYQVLASIRGGQRVSSQNPEGTYQALERYGRDLTNMARQGKLDPVIGRDEEVRRVVQVLSRRTKNNPVLIGEPGVGKTAIVEGLAQRIGATQHRGAAVETVQQRLQERKISIKLAPAAKEVLVQEGYDPVYGARPLKRTLQRRVLDPLALKVLQGEFKEGDTVLVEAHGADLTFRPLGSGNAVGAAVGATAG
ncbi:MAG: hypothetical protein EXR60_05165 [Dehalococcoidia bacterium]|nr:hypothetical protein [Dehalococcoidia bacterium]